MWPSNSCMCGHLILVTVDLENIGQCQNLHLDSCTLTGDIRPTNFSQIVINLQAQGQTFRIVLRCFITAEDISVIFYVRLYVNRDSQYWTSATSFTSLAFIFKVKLSEFTLSAIAAKRLHVETSYFIRDFEQQTVRRKQNRTYY